MPNRDGTGPMGEGPRTGRGLGNCQGNNQPLRRFGRFGFGRRGFGRRFNFWNNNSSNNNTNN